MKRSRILPVSKRTRTERWPILKALREHVLTRAKGRCEAWKVGASHPGPVDVHHVVKRSQGGRDVASNAIALCRGCHALTDAPYADGRLVIIALGGERFSATVVWTRDKWMARRLDRINLLDG